MSQQQIDLPDLRNNSATQFLAQDDVAKTLARLTIRFNKEFESNLKLTSTFDKQLSKKVFLIGNNSALLRNIDSLLAACNSTESINELRSQILLKQMSLLHFLADEYIINSESLSQSFDKLSISSIMKESY